jgi:hypothetical protein
MTAPQVLFVAGIVAYLGYVVSWLRRRRDAASKLPPIEPLIPLDDLTTPLPGHHSPLSGWGELPELPPHPPLPDFTHLPDGHGGHD